MQVYCTSSHLPQPSINQTTRAQIVYTIVDLIMLPDKGHKNFPPVVMDVKSIYRDQNCFCTRQ